MAASKKVTPQPPKKHPRSKKRSCVVCNQPWPEGPYCSSKEQQRRVTVACEAQGGIDEATRDIEHLLFAAL
jgi:hypothetical protein